VKIVSLKINKLYGRLNFNIGFFSGLNFLVGINGCGKTSVLNVLDWVLRPSLTRLAQLEFNSITIVCSDGKKEAKTVIVRKHKSNVEISIKEITKSIKVPIFESPSEEAMSGRPVPSVSEMYERFRIENKENPVLMTIENLEGPLYLPLDRRWEAAPFIRSSRIVARQRRIGRPVGQPIASVLYLAERYYREQQFKIAMFSEELREELVAYTFGDIVSLKDVRRIRQPWTVEEVKKRRETVVRGLEEASINVPEELVSKYFMGLERIAKALQKKGVDPEKPSQEYFEWAINMPQVEKVERLIERIETFNKQRGNLEKRIGAFLSTVNSFFCDTNKSIRFDTSGEMSIRVGPKHEIRADSLSSGEGQLLILFTYLYFGFEPRKEFVVMIDEPELSLHLKWQHQYVESVIKANPDAQFIFATHAPEIAQGYRGNCIEM